MLRWDVENCRVKLASREVDVGCRTVGFELVRGLLKVCTKLVERRTIPGCLNNARGQVDMSRYKKKGKIKSVNGKVYDTPEM